MLASVTDLQWKYKRRSFNVINVLMMSISFFFSDGAKLKCSFERFEKCFFDNMQEGDEFEWGPGFVSHPSKANERILLTLYVVSYYVLIER